MTRETVLIELESYLTAREKAEKALESCPATMEIEYRARIARLDEQIAELMAVETEETGAAFMGFDEDRYFGDDADAARKELSAEEQAALAEFDALCRELAARQMPLDGCEDPAMAEILACLDELTEAA